MSPQLVDLTHLSPEEEERGQTNTIATTMRLGSGAAPEGDVILCTSYLELKERGTDEGERERGTELETEQKRDTSMMKKEGMVSANSRELLQPIRCHCLTLYNLHSVQSPTALFD